MCGRVGMQEVVVEDETSRRLVEEVVHGHRTYGSAVAYWEHVDEFFEEGAWELGEGGKVGFVLGFGA